MGMHHSVRLAVYVELPKVLQTLVTKKDICSNKNCKNHSGLITASKFCPLCGEKCEVLELKKEVTEFLKWQKFVDENNLEEEEFISLHDSHILFSNYVKSITFDEYGSNSEQVVEINVELISKMKAEFMDRHIETLSQVKDILDFPLVVKFGAIQDYS
ncbi:hypothetical protein GW796_09765 [archaeon]|nr:hypothetical protein [archaeon]